MEPKIVGAFWKKDGSEGRMTWMGDGLAHFTCDDCGKFVGDCDCEGRGLRCKKCGRSDALNELGRCICGGFGG